ncbi:hypothetical protein [Aquisphaera insulae]|uniref:hypothetical protein n=1 Tax=Aquisphaera insulae TaxID=2712864 RepID=UPI0013ED3157|nr:hypothetical protein [Aquisphaera insulae]
MPRSTKGPQTPKPAEPSTGLRAALMKREQSEIVDLLMDLAQSDRDLMRDLRARFDVAPPSDTLIDETRQAIADATAFDPRLINRNFPINYAAYGEVKRNLGLLIEAGQLQTAMQLALELMKQGSYQVEMSDEGLMSDDVAGCLVEVIHAVKASDLTREESLAWCLAMLKADRVRFIAKAPLEALRTHLESSGA